MSDRLTQLQVTDFRSIRGTITVPLDAPVVLVHGPNGSGKTSLLSAIELGLTGAVASLGRFDDAYADNLVHYDADRASVSIKAAHTELSGKPAELTVQGGEIAGVPLLSASQSRFFTERSFLAQATLSRLLEIYERSDARDTASPLTRFVNDLLGLDQLETLIEGLHPAGDKRRLVKSLPLYGETNDKLTKCEKEVEHLTEKFKAAESDLAEKEKAATEALRPFGLHSLDELDEKRSQLGDNEAEQDQAIANAVLKRDIEAAQSVWRRLEQQPGGKARSGAEAALHSHEVALNEWNKTHRPTVDAALSAARRLFSDLSSTHSVGWRAAHEEAVSELSDKLATAIARLTQDQTLRKELAECREALTKAVAREAQLDEQLGALAANSGEMAQALSELAPLIDDEICPVCQRDFSETGLTSLRTHLATHISTLSQASSRLGAVADERQTVRREIADKRKQQVGLEDSMLRDSEMTALRTQRANLTEALRQLEEVAEVAQKGDELQTSLDVASEQLATLRRDEEALNGARRSAENFASQLRLDPLGESEALGVALDRYLAAANEALVAADRRKQNRRRAEDALEAHALAIGQLSEMKNELRKRKSNQKRIKNAVKTAETLRREVRILSDRAVEARTTVVREVFNESLNKVWNDLFIRLAPEEPFLPAFELPEKGKGPVEAKLITRYRGDDRGGNPKSMLSAGNLNTAALTLFLSLHLSVKPLLPWLIIDDPVQSMDEIHIAQFAALLRTLSKQRGRQVVIAVHERPLFDYLALELSPASPGERLITVELSKDSDGKTICDVTPVIWDTERVFRANKV